MLRRSIQAAVALALLLAPPASAVIGGGPASRPYPFMVSLQYDKSHTCGASVLRADWILTAAHCVEGTAAEDVGRYSAVINRTDLTTQAGSEHPVDRIVVHEQYAGDAYDVALLHLATPTDAPPIRIAGPAERGVWEPGDPARVIGWGSSVFLVGPGSDTLQEVDVPIVSDDDCATSYNGLSPFRFDPAAMVCAGESTGLKDSCQGDSGGPLIAGDLAGEPVQVGVVSFGLGCGFPVYYGVYARVADDPLRGWIAARLPAAGAPPATADPLPTAPRADAPRARLSFRSSLGSARKQRRRRALTVRLRSSAPVTRVAATLSRRGRVVSRARAGRAGRLTFRLRAAAIRPGRYRLRVQAVDGGGRRVTRSGTVRLRR